MKLVKILYWNFLQVNGKQGQPCNTMKAPLGYDVSVQVSLYLLTLEGDMTSASHLIILPSLSSRKCQVPISTAECLQFNGSVKKLLP